MAVPVHPNDHFVSETTADTKPRTIYNIKIKYGRVCRVNYVATIVLLMIIPIFY